MANLRESVEGFWSDFEAGRIGDAVARLGDDCEFVMPGAPPMRGLAALRPFFEGWRSAFPDMRHETAHAIESGATYAAETDFRGTHRGALRSANGELPATGREVRWRSADVLRFADGKIVSWHVYHDPGVLFAQLTG